MGERDLIIQASEIGVRSCYGLGEVDGGAVSWLCTGHGENESCRTAYIVVASRGDHFLDEASGACFVVRKGRVVPCDGRCAGTEDVDAWPSLSVNDGIVRILRR